MCRELRALRQSISEYAEAFDVHALIPSQASEVVKLCSQIEASIAAVKAMAIAKSSEGTAWKHLGYRSPSDQIAQETGMSPGRAKRMMQTGQRLNQQPDVAKAALAGRLSPEQAEAVSDGAAANADKTQDLIDKAHDLSMPELNQEVAKTKSEATDLEARRRGLHTKRSLRRWTDREGAGHAHLFGNPESTITLWRAIDPIRRRLRMLGRSGEEPKETFEAIDHDALLVLAAVATGEDSQLSMKDLLDLGLFPQLDSSVFASRTPPTSDEQPPPPSRKRSKKLAGSPTKIIVRVDLDALLRGVPMEGELCEIDGYGSVALSVIEDLIAAGNTFLAAALVRNHKLTGVHHHGRRPNAYQKTALEFIYPECAVKGCKVREGLEADHREDWAKTHFTVTDLLDHLCRFHHKLKTHKGWALVEGHGKRDFVPPDDARHPRNLGHNGSSPPPPIAAPAKPLPKSTPPKRGPTRKRSRNQLAPTLPGSADMPVLHGRAVPRATAGQSRPHERPRSATDHRAGCE